MSAFGPALFVSRADGAPLPEGEQSAILTHIRAATARLGLPRAVPRVYDYDGYEPLALGVLLYSEYGYQHMPDDVREDQDRAWADQGVRVGAEVEKQAPGVYNFTAYTVED
ncbi:hypothetical protein [Actinoplanes sp. NPDC026670]|jgi:hypothetical protein|uniref:hypothetical protein n=1 Tax=Actinoplanes sp. NPDC026670 TaxID=3154700 RepID=UPI0033D622F5